MSRTIKRIIYILLVLLAATVLSLILPKNIVTAAKGDIVEITASALEEGDIYCVEKGQALYFTGSIDYKVVKTATIEAGNIIKVDGRTLVKGSTEYNAYFGLFAIIGEDTLGNLRGKWGVDLFEKSEKNNYVWHHIYNNSVLKSYLTSKDWIQYINSTKYNNIITNTNKSYEGTIEFMQNAESYTRSNGRRYGIGDMQTLIKADVTSQVNEPKIYLDIFKEDMNGKGLRRSSNRN